MSSRETAGEALVAQLDTALPAGVEWTPIERATLASVEVMANRLDALRERTDAMLADPEAVPAQLAVLANATRCLEVSVHTLIRSLDPEMLAKPKSVQHQAAARSRWSRGAAV